MDDDRDEYWRAPMQGSDWSGASRMLRRLRDDRRPVPSPNLSAKRRAAPRMPTVDDYVGLGLSREAAERAVAAFNRQPNGVRK